MCVLAGVQLCSHCFEVKFLKHEDCCIYDKLCKSTSRFLYFLYLRQPSQYLHNILNICFLFILFSYFEKYKEIYETTLLSECLCVSPFIVAGTFIEPLLSNGRLF